MFYSHSFAMSVYYNFNLLYFFLLSQSSAPITCNDAIPCKGSHILGNVVCEGKESCLESKITGDVSCAEESSVSIDVWTIYLHMVQIIRNTNRCQHVSLYHIYRSIYSLVISYLLLSLLLTSGVVFTDYDVYFISHTTRLHNILVTQQQIAVRVLTAQLLCYFLVLFSCR